MSQLTNTTPPENEENKTFESVDDLLKHFSSEVSPVKTFSNSSMSNLTKEAKKLKKNSEFGHKEALHQVAIHKGFKSFNDFRTKFEYWKSLPTVYIYIQKHQTVYQTKEVYNRLPEDDQSKSIKELMEDIDSNSMKWFNEAQSFTKPVEPVTVLDNQKFGIKLLTEDEKDVFFKSFEYEDSFEFRSINKENDFLFKFIHYKLDPKEMKKLIEGYDQVVELIDTNLRAYLTTEIYTEDTYIYERFDVDPQAYIVGNKYYDTYDLYNPYFEEYGRFSQEDY